MSIGSSAVVCQGPRLPDGDSLIRSIDSVIAVWWCTDEQ